MMKKGMFFKKVIPLYLVLSLVTSILIGSNSYALDEYQQQISESENVALQSVSEEVYERPSIMFAPESAEKTVLYGDINGDGDRNSIDFAIMRMYLLGIIKDFDSKKVVEDYDSMKAADVSGDGNISAIDFALMRQFLMGMIKIFPAEKTVTEPVTVTGISIEDKVLKLNLGEEHIVEASVLPSNADKKDITWSSDNSEIATVSQSGTVTAVNTGAANIIAETVEGGFKTYCNVIVSQPADGMTLDKSTYSMKTGDSVKLNAVFTPENTTNQKIKWSSDNTDVASVGQGGVVTAFSTGTATITAESEDGGYTSSCTIVVTQKTLGLRLEERVIKINVGETASITAKALPSNAGNKNINWSSSNTSIATVDESGIVTAVKAGEVYIKAEPEEGIYTDSCKVVVIQPVKGISLDKSSLKLKVGFGYALKTIFSPTDSTLKKVKWTSSDEKVAKVNENGAVSALSSGTATITATSVSGSFTSKCTVTVVAEAMSAPVVTGSRASTGITLSWGAVTGAQSYTVKRGEYIGDLVEIKTDLTGTSYTDTTAKSDTTYYYVVSSSNSSGISRNSNLQIFKAVPKTPKLFGIKTIGNSRLTWTSANGADRYDVYRSTTKGGTYSTSNLIAKNVLSNTYEDRNIGEVKYYYVIKAINEKGESSFSNEIKISDEAVKPLDFISTTDDDGDGVSNVDELFSCTKPNQYDTDGDGLSDGYELKIGTNPLNPDTDSDGLYDGSEVILGTGPLVKNQNAATITAQKEAVNSDGTATVKAEGDGNLVIAPLQIVPTDNILVPDASLDTPGVVSKVDVVAGNYPISNLAVTFKYDKTNLKGVPEAELAVMYFNEEAIDSKTGKKVKAFEALSSMKSDTTNCKVSGNDTRYGTYVLGDKDLAPSFQSIDIILFIDQAAIIKADPLYDMYRYRTLAAYSLVDWIYSNPSAESRYNVGIVTYDDSGTYGSINKVQGITNDRGVLLAQLQTLLETDPSVPSAGPMDWQPIVNEFFYNGTTNKKIMVTFSSGPINSIPYVVSYINTNFKPRGFIVDTIGVGKNAYRSGLQQIASAGNGKYFEINSTGYDSDDAVINQLGTVCNSLSQQFSLQSYVKGTYTPQTSANIEFSDEYKGMDNRYSNEWITGAGTNLLTGSYMESHKDIQITSNGYDLAFERTYNSNSNKDDSIIGKGFRTNFDAKIEEKVSSAKVTASILNVRSGPGTNNVSIGQVSNGTTLEVLEKNVNGSDWHKVSFNGYANAYVSASYVDEKSTVEVTYPTGTKTSFDVNADGTYKSPFWSDDTLEKKNGEYIVTSDDMSKIVFNVSTKRLVRVEDRSGNVLNIIYDTNGRIDYVSDTTGRKLDFSFNTDGKLDTIKDTLTNRTVQYKYSDGLLMKVIDGELKETAYEYDFNNRIEKVTDANDNETVRVEYDALGRIVRQYDAEGNVRYQVYSDSTNERYVIDAKGNESRTRFNLDMRVVEEVDALGNKVKYEYSYYNPDTKKWEVIPDIDIRTLEDNKDPKTKAFNTYLTAGKSKRLKTREKMYDKKGKPTTNEYDENHNLVSTLDPLEQTTSMTYDPVYKNNMLTKTDKKGKTTTLVYDNEGKYGPKGAQLVKEVDPLGNELVYDYYTNETGIKLKGLVKKVTEKKRVDQDNPKSELIDFKVTEYKYADSYNNRTEIIDALGNHTFEEYDAAGRLERITNARGYTTKYTYDNNDRLKVEEVFPKTEETKVLKRTISTYDNVGNKLYVTSERFAADRPDYPKEDLKTETVYDRNNRPVHIYNPQGYRVSYTYDAVGNRVTETDQRGFTTVYSYDELNRVRTMQDPLKNMTAYEYDANSNVVKVTDAKNRDTFVDYDELGRKWKMRFPYKEDGKDKEAVTEYLYDANDNLYRAIDSIGKITEYVYDDLNRVTKATDGLGFKGKDGKSIEKVVTYSYNYESVAEDGKTVKYEVVTENDYLTSAKIRPIILKNDALGRMRLKYETSKEDKTIQEYDEIGNLKSVQDARGNITSYEYDGLNNIIKVADATRTNYSEAVFDSVGNVIEKIDRRKNKTEYRYNKLNKVIKTTTWFTDEDDVKQEVVTTISYDEAGNKKTATDGVYNTTLFSYDELGRLVSETNPIYNTQYFGYDAMGNQSWVTDWKEHDSTENSVYPVINEHGATVYRLRTNYNYDEFDRLESVTNTEGEITNYTYDVVGNIKTVTVDGVEKTSNFYDNMYRLEKVLDGEGRTETYDSYDLFGRLTQKTDRSGQVHTYTYDEYDNVETHTVARKVIENEVEKTVNDIRETYYDAVGNVVRTVDETGEATYEYNELNLLDYKVLPGEKLVDYDYDEEGNVIEIKDPSGNTTTYFFDEMNRMKTVTTKDGTTTYAYGKNGNRKSVKLANNALTTYEYDARNVLTKLVNQVGSIVDIYEYEYDENSLQVSKIESKGKTSFEYDNLGRIESVTEPGGRITTYAYGGAGNRETQTVEDLINGISSQLTYHYDDSNRLTDILEVRNGKNITTVYAYDGNGNQTKVTVTEPGDVINESEYTFDGFNQLKVAKSQESTTTSKYDAFGMRVEKTVDKVTTKYYYNGQSVLLEVRSDGVENCNVQGVNLIARKANRDSDTLYYLYNGHADVVKIVDGTGNKVNEYDYDIFGNILYQQESKPNPYKYSGYYYDDDTGYYYLRSRYYDPQIARFISEDTVTGQYNDPLSLNLYTYCQNDPITYDDPNGHWLHIAAGALIGGLVNTAITAVSDYMEDGEFNKNWREYAGSFAEGAIVGAVGAATGGASFAAMAASSVAASMAGNAVGQYIAKGKVDIGEVVFSGATDLLSMGAGKLAGNLTKKGMDKFASTAFGESVLKKANSMKSKLLNRISGIKTKTQAIASFECKKPSNKFTRTRKGISSRSISEGSGWNGDAVSKFVDPSVIGKHPQSPLFYSIPNNNGARIHVSIDEITQQDFKPIVNDVINNTSNNKLVILSGTHGDELGKLNSERLFFNQDRRKFGYKPNVKVVDITKIKSEELSDIINGGDDVLCAWCYSERSKAILKALKFIP